MPAADSTVPKSGARIPLSTPEIARPVAIAANTTYVVAYFTSTGCSNDRGFFTATGVDNGPLHALRSGVDGGNGLYVYASAPQFPNSSYVDTNYWVDVVFK